MTQTREAYPPLDGLPTALCLCGGGLTGAFYEIGVLGALAEAGKPFHPERADLYVGTSAGALLAALLAGGVPVHRLHGAVLGEPGSFPLRRRDFYRLEPGRAASLFLRALGVGTRFLRAQGRKKGFDDLEAAAHALPAGLFRADAFHDFVNAAFRFEGLPTSFRALRRPLFIPATDLDRGERVVFGPGARDDTPIPSAIVASSAIPIFFEPVEIGESRFIDGMATEVAHLDLAVTRGARRVLVVNPMVPVCNDRTRVCLPSPRGGCARIDEKGFFAVLDQAARLETRTRLLREIEATVAKNPGVEVFLIQPAETDAMMFLYNPMTFSTRERVMRYGYESAARAIVDGRVPRFGETERPASDARRTGSAETADAR